MQIQFHPHCTTVSEHWHYYQQTIWTPRIQTKCNSEHYLASCCPSLCSTSVLSIFNCQEYFAYFNGCLYHFVLYLIALPHTVAHLWPRASSECNAQSPHVHQYLSPISQFNKISSSRTRGISTGKSRIFDIFDSYRKQKIHIFPNSRVYCLTGHEN